MVVAADPDRCLLNLTVDGSCTSKDQRVSTLNINSKCAVRSNTTSGQIINPVRSARLTTAGKKTIKYGRVLGWLDEPDSELDQSGWSSTAIATKGDDEGYSFFPANVSSRLATAISRLDETAVLAMSSTFTIAIISSLCPGERSLIVEGTSARIPIVLSLNDVTLDLIHLTRCCIVVRERIILIWSHDASAILNVALDVEKQLGKNVEWP